MIHITKNNPRRFRRQELNKLENKVYFSKWPYLFSSNTYFPISEETLPTVLHTILYFFQDNLCLVKAQIWNMQGESQVTAHAREVSLLVLKCLRGMK